MPRGERAIKTTRINGCYAPELNPMENVWDYLRGNKLSGLIWISYEAILAACKKAWLFLVNDPERIVTIGTGEWACVKG
jgi:hypothetical protein